MGILCKHALKVLNFVKVHSVPDHCINKRWTKNARNWVLREVTGSGSGHDSEMEFVNQTMRLVYDLSVRCKSSNMTRKMLAEFLHGATKKAEDWFENSSSDESSMRISKETKRKRKISKTATNECLPQVATHAPLSQEANNVQPSVCKMEWVDYPLQEASSAAQSCPNHPNWPYPVVCDEPCDLGHGFRGSV